MSITRERRIACVPAADDMTREIFCLHMTHRHHDSLAGMDELSAELTPYVESLYRSFHRRLHEIRIDYDHAHAPTDNYERPGDRS